MKLRFGLSLAVELVLILSLCVLAYSAFQIFKAPADARSALEDWAKKREEAPLQSTQEQEDEAPIQSTQKPVEETPLPDLMVAPAGEAEGGSADYTEGEVIGEIYLPALKTRAAILEGTQRPQLKRGAGHYAGSAAIGAVGNSVLAGHRDTVFRSLGKLKEHDLIEVETEQGRFIYEMIGSTIVDADERGAIQPSSTPILTLITCYPFSYVGPAPERYLLTAALLRREPLQPDQD